MKTIHLLFTSIAITGVLGAQAGAGTDRAPFHAGKGFGVIRDGDSTPWLLGPDYKASIVDGAMQFVPALGALAPHSRPLTFRLRSIAIGPEVQFEATSDAATSVSGNRVTIARGEFRECYEATARGVEQTFVQPRRPAVQGDLVVTGTLDTTLEAHANPDGSLSFTDAEQGGVTISRVIGVDATGATCDGTLSLVGGELELRLPAAFVAAATYPLTLDPLFGATLQPGGLGNDDREVDTAYDDTFETYLVVWRRSFSSVDQDIRAQRFAADGSPLGAVLAITNTTASEVLPVVASIHQRNRFVVAWQSGASPFGPWTVMARTVAADSGALGTTVTVGTGVSPAICGDRDPTTSTALIVYAETGVAIRARTATVDAAGSIASGTTFTVANLSSSIALYGPKIPKSHSANASTVVTWAPDPMGGNLYAQAVNGTGIPASNLLTVVLASPYERSHAIDGDGHQFLIAYQSAEMDLVSLELNGTSLAITNTTQMLGTIGARSPAVGWLGDRYLVAYEQPLANPFTATVRGRAVDPNCAACGNYFQVPVVNAASQRRPAIATQWSGGGTTQDALLAWDETVDTPPFSGNIAAQRFARTLGSPPAVLSPSCSGGGTTGIDTPFALGNQAFHITLTGADPSAPIALLGLAVGNPAPIACGCTFSQALLYYAMLAVGGNAQFALGVPCDPGLIGFELECQWVLLGAAVSPCPFVQGLIASDRVRLTLAE